MICGVLAVSVCSDVLTYKVRNPILLAGFCLGLFARAAELGMRGALTGLLGAAVPIALLGFLFYHRMLGAGDVKLFSVIGGAYGPASVIDTILLAFLAGGVLSVIRLIQTGCLKQRLRYFTGFIFGKMRAGEAAGYFDMERDGEDAAIPFAVAIGIAFLLQRYFSVTIFSGGMA